MISLASELEALYESFLREHLAGYGNQFGKAGVACKDTDKVGAAGDPDKGFVLLSFQMTPGINVEKLRMQGPLIQRERQLTDSQIYLRRFHT